MIVTNKFDLFWSTQFSYTILNIVEGTHTYDVAVAHPPPPNMQGKQLMIIKINQLPVSTTFSY